jgi:hypothetical protein
VSIWGLSWPWKTKKGRTVESYDKRGRRRILCANGGAPVTGEITTQEVGVGRDSRWTHCPECDCQIRVTGLISQPRLIVHNAKKK